MSVAIEADDGQGPFSELSAFQRDLLAIIADEDGEYGLGIKRRIESLYAEDVNHGRLYPNLDELVEMGYVEKSELDKRTNQYKLTHDGEGALRRLSVWFDGCLEGGEDQ